MLNYYIISGNEQRYFSTSSVHRASGGSIGFITVVRKLDHEDVSEFTLKIAASDSKYNAFTIANIKVCNAFIIVWVPFIPGLIESTISVLLDQVGLITPFQNMNCLVSVELIYLEITPKRIGYLIVRLIIYSIRTSAGDITEV